jgi:DNA-binding NarL/FixJ family response regulator
VIGSAVVCDGSGFNLRFLRAAMVKLGYRQVLEAKTLDELEHKVCVMQPDLVVFDPAMEDGAGLDLLKVLAADSPDSSIVAFCSDDSMARSVKWLGFTTVEKISILQVDALVAAIEVITDRTADVPDVIPNVDVSTPVWDQVPSLVQPG